MLKIAHIRNGSRNESVRALAEIFKANDLKRQEKRVEQLKLSGNKNKKVIKIQSSQKS
jgi:hypothetical protein